MLIPTIYRTCTAFICATRANPRTGDPERRPIATAFLVGVPTSPGLRRVYAVTARHVIEGARAAGEDLYLRVNLKTGEPFEDLPLPPDPVPKGGWTTADLSDVAAAHLPMRDDFDVRPLDVERFVTDEFAAKRQLGPGDDVFVIGLFSLHYGQRRSEPIARFGNVSLMPEPVKVVVRLKDRDGEEWLWEQEITGYLVEARSFGGVSGSPAFVYFPVDRFAGGVVIPPDEGRPWVWNDLDDPPEPEDEKGDAWPKLLGIVSSHFDITQDVTLQGDVLGSGQVQANAGIAVVVPAQDIMELLMDPDLKQERDEAAEHNLA